MYYSITLLVFLMTAGINMNELNLQTPILEQEKMAELPSEQKCKKKMVDINPIVGKYTVQVGQQLRYSASIHGSVGFTASASSSDGEFLPLSKSYTKYDNKRHAKLSGGDSATKYFIFDVKKTGSYTIRAKRYFRGDLKDDYTIEITVIE